MKSISSVLKRRKKTRNIFLTKKQAYILHSIHRKGRGNNLCLPKISAATTVIATSTTEQEQYDNDPAGIIAIAAAASVSIPIVSAQTHQTDDPENTITGVISKKTVSIATATVVITSSRFCLHFILCSESFMRYLQLSEKRNNFYFHIIFVRIYMKILLKRELK